MSWVDYPGAEYGDKLVELMLKLDGTIFLESYSSLFPNDVSQDDLRPHYEILDNEKNRELMVAIYSNGRLDINSIAEKLALTPKEVRERLKFFRANGMRKIA